MIDNLKIEACPEDETRLILLIAQLEAMMDEVRLEQAEIKAEQAEIKAELEEIRLEQAEIKAEQEEDLKFFKELNARMDVALCTSL
jgi:septal ring factor EnvC (AmiA/AmiB activator)